MTELNSWFQHTAARRRLLPTSCNCLRLSVSTHSRPKAAGNSAVKPVNSIPVSTHSRPKAAGLHNEADSSNECFNTQPPEGGCRLIVCPNRQNDSFNTQPPEGGCDDYVGLLPSHGFQHTAARRRLVLLQHLPLYCHLFQHTAARRRLQQAQDLA